jgi:nucleolin
MTIPDDESSRWEEKIVSLLENGPQKVKKLRKQLLLSFQLDSDDKASKKKYKQVVQAMEQQGRLSIDEEGIVKLQKRKIEQESGENKRSKVVVSCTRLFLGNLPFSVDEASLEAFIPGITHIKWITDKETGRFYGSAFCEMNDASSAANAVAASGKELLGRAIKINYAPARPGDVWPPEKSVVSGGGGGGGSGGQAGGKGIKAMSAKPEHCVKLFIGNLSYDIDDDTLIQFFTSVDAEVKAVRWLHHRDSGDFKGT